MRLSTVVFIAISLLATTTVVASPVHQWSQQFASTAVDFPNRIAVDANGDILLTGQYGTGASAFLAKYDAIGVEQWIRWFGPGIGYDVSVDASGNVFVTGSLGTYPPMANPPVDIFLKKFDASGTLQWSKTFVGPSYDEGLGVGCDAAGNVVMTGRFTGTVDFGGGPLTSAGFDDVVVAAYDPSGAHVWSRRFGGTSGEYGSSVVIDESGNVFVTGAFRGSVDFGGGVLTSAGGFDMFLAEYDASGAHVWSRRYGSPAFTDYGLEVVLDGQGNIVVSGSFTGTVDFGGGPLTSAGEADGFVAKYDVAGAHEWSQGFGTTAFNQAKGLAVDASGNVIVTGFFKGDVDFGGGTLTSAGEDDVFLASFDANGAHAWSVRFGGGSYDGGTSVDLDPQGNIVMAGYFIDAIDLGGGLLVGSGDADIFYAKFAPTMTSIAPMASAALGQNHPNPFNPSTTIEYSLREESPVALTIYDAAGALIARLDQGIQSAGPHSVRWNGRDSRDRPVASGMYFYRLEGMANVPARKMLLLK